MPTPYSSLPGEGVSALWVPPTSGPQLERGRVQPEIWRDRLNKKLDARQNELLLYDAYYFGEHRLAYATGKYKEAFGNLFTAWSDNWCDVVVDASVERLVPIGLSFDGAEADREAWEIWQANDLDCGARLAHLECIKSKEAYLLVAPPEKPGEEPQITVESPLQMIVEYAPGNRNVVLAALKKWVDEYGRILCTLYLPDAIYRWEAEGAGSWSQWQPLGVAGGPAAWIERKGVEFRSENPVGQVTVVPLQNDPTLMRGGRSDINRVIPLQDAINKILNDGLIASEFGAFQQRVLLGVEVPRDPETGRPIPFDELRASMSRLWVFEDQNARIHEFSQVDLTNFYKFAEQMIQHVAAQARVPLHYFITSNTGYPTGDALKPAEAGLVMKVKGKMSTLTDQWVKALRFAFKLKGEDEKASNDRAKLLWKDPEVRTQSELSDALVKRRAIGVPLEQLWREAGYTPEQIESFKLMREREQDDETLYTLTPHLPSRDLATPQDLTGQPGLQQPNGNQPPGTPDQSSKGNTQPVPKPRQSGLPQPR